MSLEGQTRVCYQERKRRTCDLCTNFATKMARYTKKGVQSKFVLAFCGEHSGSFDLLLIHLWEFTDFSENDPKFFPWETYKVESDAHEFGD